MICGTRSKKGTWATVSVKKFLYLNFKHKIVFTINLYGCHSKTFLEKNAAILNHFFINLVLLRRKHINRGCNLDIP